MDDLVRAAMAKWPHVPDCRGWLALDARGEPLGPVLTSRCAASRWDGRTVLERDYAGGGLQQLLAGARYASDLSRAAVTR